MYFPCCTVYADHIGILLTWDILVGVGRVWESAFLNSSLILIEGVLGVFLPTVSLKGPREWRDLHGPSYLGLRAVLQPSSHHHVILQHSLSPAIQVLSLSVLTGLTRWRVSTYVFQLTTLTVRATWGSLSPKLQLMFSECFEWVHAACCDDSHKIRSLSNQRWGTFSKGTLYMSGSLSCKE